MQGRHGNHGIKTARWKRVGQEVAREEGDVGLEIRRASSKSHTSWVQIDGDDLPALTGYQTSQRTLPTADIQYSAAAWRKFVPYKTVVVNVVIPAHGRRR